MDMPVVFYKKLHEDAKEPTRGTENSAGLDLYCLEDTVIEPWRSAVIRTGLAFEIPDGYFGHLVTRSSLGVRRIRMNAGANVVDADYRGEVLLYMANDYGHEAVFKKGDRVAQMVIVPYLKCRVEESEELSKTERGTGGFGSTGK